MAKIFVGAVDCSFNYCGWSFSEYDRETKKTTLKATGIEKVHSKERGTIADLWQSCELYGRLQEILENWSIGTGKDDSKIFALEVPGGSQSSRAASCLGMARGVLGAACNYAQTMLKPRIDSIELVTPNEVHKHVTGKRKASKEEVMDYILINYDAITVEETARKYTFEVATEEFSQYTKGEFEHIADSLVIGEVALERTLR